LDLLWCEFWVDRLSALLRSAPVELPKLLHHPELFVTDIRTVLLGHEGARFMSRTDKREIVWRARRFRMVSPSLLVFRKNTPEMAPGQTLNHETHETGEQMAIRSAIAAPNPKAGPGRQEQRNF